MDSLFLRILYQKIVIENETYNIYVYLIFIKIIFNEIYIDEHKYKK